MAAIVAADGLKYTRQSNMGLFAVTAMRDVEKGQDRVRRSEILPEIPSCFLYNPPAILRITMPTPGYANHPTISRRLRGLLIHAQTITEKIPVHYVQL